MGFTRREEKEQVPSGSRDVLEGDPPEGTEQILMLSPLCLSTSNTRTQVRRLGGVHWVALE